MKLFKRDLRMQLTGVPAQKQLSRRVFSLIEPEVITAVIEGELVAELGNVVNMVLAFQTRKM